jgi:hypothetical protein
LIGGEVIAIDNGKPALALESQFQSKENRQTLAYIEAKTQDT